MLRLRQAVLVARDIDAVTEALREALPLGDPFHDEGVGHFGLRNAVMALGDTFVEVVSPVQEGTAAGRFLDRLGGDGGYMVMFQLDDIDAARERIGARGIRIVFEVDLPDVVDLHLHPADVGGAIVALDRCTPPESWRWGGPAWTATAPPEHGPGRITGATLSSPDPEGMAERWAGVLDRPVGVGPRVELDDGELRFIPGSDEGIAAFHVAGVDHDVEVAGVRFGPAP